MLISVCLRVFCTSMYDHCVSSPAKARFVSSICPFCNETCEDSRTRSRLVCTNPSLAIHSLVCGTRVLTRASNKIKRHTGENYLSCKLGCELYHILITQCYFIFISYLGEIQGKYQKCYNLLLPFKI